MARDSEVPAGTRKVQRPDNQEEGGPTVGAVREAHDAGDGRDTATESARNPEDTEMAVFPWRNHTLHAGSRGRCPPPAQAFRSVVVVGYVHESRLLRIVLQVKPLNQAIGQTRDWTPA